MGTIEPDRLLAPVAEQQPCGANLEYDGQFLAMVQAATGKPERRMGEQVIAAEEPNWKAVRQAAIELTARSKDLRIVVPLCRALLHTDGWSGLAAGLELLAGLCERYWPDLYPALDKDDDDDPTMRVNVLSGLCDTAQMLRSVREVPLVRARAAGAFGLRELDYATGRTPLPAGATPVAPELVRAAFQEVPADQLKADAAAVQAAATQATRLGRLLDERLSGRAPNLRPFTAALTTAAAEFDRQLQQRGLAGATPAAGGDAAAPAAAGASSTAPSTASPGASMQIQSRDDVVAWLDRICDFYQRTEPSSPVPILLQRARRLVNKSFLDVIKDLVPDALSQAEAFRGQVES